MVRKRCADIVIHDFVAGFSARICVKEFMGILHTETLVRRVPSPRVSGPPVELQVVTGNDGGEDGKYTGIWDIWYLVSGIWYSHQEKGITSWEDSRCPRDLVNRCAAGRRNFKPTWSRGCLRLPGNIDCRGPSHRRISCVGCIPIS